MKEGNGDPSLVLFGEKVTPNEHKIARQFVLLDNFYVNGDVSADGHSWSTAAIATDYIQKMWPNSYANRRRPLRLRRAGALPMRLPPDISGSALRAREFPCATTATWRRIAPLRPPTAAQVELVRDPVLRSVTNLHYRDFDLEYPDVERVKVFLANLDQFEKSGVMPRLIFMRLGNDHTSGTQRGKLTPIAMNADNDYALGMLVEAVSKSRFWSSTAHLSCWRTTRRTVPTTSIRTARPRFSSRPTSGIKLWIARCTTPPPCCAPWN